jgi:hypothetical protein
MPLDRPAVRVPGRVRAAGLILAILSLPAAASAQGTPLASILPELLGNTITLLPSNLPDQPNHVAHFQPGRDQIQAPAQMNRALLTLLSTYPLGSPSGGFTYTFDPALGTLTRSSNSFGPSFAERALTTGRGKSSIGFGYQHAAYDTFEGLNLRQDGVTFYVQHTDCCSRGSAQQSIPDDDRKAIGRDRGALGIEQQPHLSDIGLGVRQERRRLLSQVPSSRRTSEPSAYSR